MPSVRRLLCISLTLAALASPGAAVADPPRSDSDPCRGRHAGEPCEADDFEGTCRSRRCTRETDNGLRSSRCLVCESRRHGHHRRHRDATVEEDDATVADAGDDASTDVSAEVVAVDAPARRDAAVVARPAAPPPKEGFFACAAGPRGGDGGAWGAVGMAVCAALQGRARGRWRRRTAAPL